METLTLIFLGQTAIPMRTGQTLLCKNLAIAFIYHEASVAPKKDDPEREEGGSCLKQVNWLKFECWR
jgi:hypothetical protein